MNKLNLIVWGLPMYPVLWLYTALLGRSIKSRFPPAKEITHTLHEAYKQHWNNSP